MKYRMLGNTGLEVSVLGFGAMRLPIKGGLENPADIFNPEKPVDEEHAGRMVEYAVQRGINYFDTAYGYHGGQSEPFLGKALEPHRDRVLIATKMPVWMIQAPDDYDRILDEQLERLRTGRIDVYLLHGLNRQYWPRVRDGGVGEFLDRARGDGRIGHAGFSFHDDIHMFKEIVSEHPWEVCQIQYNFYDENYQAGHQGLRYAAERGIGIIAMEPLRGGKIVDPVPDKVRELWSTAPVERSALEWAWRWVWDEASVATALSGMSTLEQLKQNVDLAVNARAGSLSEAERELIGRVRDAYRSMLRVDCTHCAYCMPCPYGVNIPMNFSLYNDTFMFRDAEVNFMLYNHMLPPEQRASNCQECGECEPKCPQNIQIIEELKTVHGKLHKGPG
ncbi:MAG: aldo/keto reductase [bacterium]|nr:MAG: aldo/keto reductase [bacterium]